ncbi:MAG: dephospho-CoA kinase [Gemmatimonadetes bacterium]|nr:dephospho-CoA kinase [Gemmatimonadota bacterium]NIR80521.1 dephospho-CoA kinase [Gemmatimonadota bacterium]NIT87999.1 dephospho-CoA kinase [Gemmatimonadota bacterium]NIU33088.1 dephospho-CoA kinase [Gemmatimonadota bacterium]NIU37459.1 dephospho-CoA kinase [Gemmatimonadota bacterium]
MLTVGLTGSVASGKSTVARVWAEAGVPVVSADELARRAVRPGSSGLEEVARAFGEEILAPDGSLDRGALRRRVFRDEKARRRLEGILHPRIEALRRRWIEERREEGAPLVVAEVPLLFEVGLADDFDVTVVVHAGREERLRRLVEERGLAEDEARRMIDAQLDPEEKRRRADVVLENDGTIAELEERADRLLDRLRAGAAGGRS